MAHQWTQSLGDNSTHEGPLEASCEIEYVAQVQSSIELRRIERLFNREIPSRQPVTRKH